jgi:hypothetical protein
MRRLLASVGFISLYTFTALAQTPTPPHQPTHPEPGRLPANLTAPPPQSQPTALTQMDGLPKADPSVRLPQPERLVPIDANGLTARRGVGQDRWQIASGLKVVREFGSAQADAEEFVRLLRELKPTEWGAIGTDRVVVEYGLNRAVLNGVAVDRATAPAFTPKTTVNIDLSSVRVETVRGVWVLRDEDNILLNFGKNQQDAEQAIGVIRKYGLNRIAQVGPTTGGATVLFAQPETASVRPKATGGLAELNRQYQEQKLARTGLEVPAAGAAGGEKFAIDPKACEIRRDKGGHWVLAHGGEVLANFGASEWSARDALKLVQEQRFTEFCRFNADVTFFLVNGQPPTRVPFAVQAVRFDTGTLTVKAASSGKFGVYEGMGRLLFTCDTDKEAKALVATLQHYGFDTSCQMGLSSKSALRFLAKTGR